MPPAADEARLYHQLMFSGRSIPLVRVFGIRVGVDPSWFLVLFLFIWLLTDYYKEVPGRARTARSRWPL